MIPNDLIGKQFGMLTVFGVSSKRNQKGNWVYKCRCNCEKKTKIDVIRGSLISGNTRSCGCTRIEFIKSQKTNFIGKVFDRLRVVELVGKNKYGSLLWKCICACNNKNIVICSTNCLTQDNTRSCGCLKKESIGAIGKKHFKNLIGQTFGLLKPIERIDTKKDYHSKYLCECQCEKKNKVVVFSNNLTRGHSTSCGCKPYSYHGKETYIEKLIRQELEKRKIQFKQEYLAQAPFLTVDFFLPQYKLLIYCDGKYWHKKDNRRKQDYVINAKLRRAGYKVIRFWEDQIKRDPTKCIDKALAHV